MNIQYQSVVLTVPQCYPLSVSLVEFYNVPIICHDYVYLCAFVHVGSQNIE